MGIILYLSYSNDVNAVIGGWAKFFLPILENGSDDMAAKVPHGRVPRRSIRYSGDSMLRNISSTSTTYSGDPLGHK